MALFGRSLSLQAAPGSGLFMPAYVVGTGTEDQATIRKASVPAGPHVLDTSSAWLVWHL